MTSQRSWLASLVLTVSLLGGYVDCGCFHPRPPDNGDVRVNVYGVQPVAFFTCKPGYVLLGNNVSVCQNNDQWSHSGQSCANNSPYDPSRLVQCNLNDALLPVNSRLPSAPLRRQYNAGQSIDLECNPEFVLIQSMNLFCLDIGQWAVYGGGHCAPQPPPQRRSSTTRVEHLTSVPGSIITIPCPVSPNAVVVKRTWLKNSSDVKNSEPDAHVSDHGVLIISRVTALSAGTYVCLVYTGDSISVSAAVELNVQPTSTGTPVPQRSHCRFSLAPSPTVTIGASIGERAYLSCGDSNKYRTMAVKWYKDGIVVAHGSGNGTLVIPSVELAHSGAYICESRITPDCTLTREVRLNVLHKEIDQQLPKPNFIPDSDYWQPHVLSVCGQPDLSSNPGGRRLKIVDGVKAPRGSTPWMAMIAWRGRRGGLFCGGTLISDRFVLTAAHCFRHFLSQEQIRSNVVIKLGKLFRYQIEPDEVIMPVRRVIIHSGFSNITSPSPNVPLSNDNDIALVELQRPVAITGQILPVCIPPRGFMKHNMAEGSIGKVTGWGFQHERGPPSRTLQQVRVPLVSAADCNSSSAFTITRNMFCAGYEESYLGDTCKGDSGGPFTVQFQQRWYIAGIVSWGEGCSRPHKYGIYTRVDRFFDWIMSHISDP